MRKHSWAIISSAMGIKAVVLVIILNFVYVMPVVMASGNMNDPISVRVDLPQNDSMKITDSMTSSFSSFGHYLGPPCGRPSDWSDCHSNILWAGSNRLNVKDNLEGNQDSHPFTNNFRNRHPIHPVVTCQNANCAYFNQEAGKNIIKYGKNRNGRQKFMCHHCKRFFMETYDTHLFDSRINDDEYNIIYWLLLQKHSNRSIEKITGHSRNTIGRILTAFSEHPKNTERIVFLSINIPRAEMAEIWRTVSNNRKNRCP
jgi:transposase-like protein